MFTVITALFKLVGINLTDTTIRIGLIALGLVALLGCGFFFRHEIQSFIATEVYAVDAKHQQAVNEAQIKILQDQIVQQQAAIADLTKQHEQVQSNTDRIITKVKSGKYKPAPVGPATQATIDELRKTWPKDTADDGVTIQALPSIQAWKSHGGAADGKK